VNSEPENAFIILKDVTKRYWDVVALDHISLKIMEGEVFGYIGPNGAGKTTTIKILVGLLSDFQGDLQIAGHSMPTMRGRVHRLLGYLPQEFAFQEWRTVDHTLRTFGRLSGLETIDLERRIDKVLGITLLTDVQHKKIRELSGGMVQKLGLAQALLHKPKLLVLDEPLAGLDPASRHQVKSVLRELRAQGTTIFFSSHILSDVQDIATRIGILHQGRIRQTGTLDDLLYHFGFTDDLDVELSRNSGRWEELEALSAIHSIEQTSPNKLLVHLDREADRDETIHQLIVGLINLDCRIRSLKPVARSLDEVYLRYLEGDQHV
jgi:ABC-2 type transport system ATP-binding protein